MHKNHDLGEMKMKCFCLLQVNEYHLSLYCIMHEHLCSSRTFLIMNPFELQLQTVVGCHVIVLGVEPGSSKGAASALNKGACKKEACEA